MAKPTFGASHNLRLARNRLLRFQPASADRSSHRRGRGLSLTYRRLTVMLCGSRLAASCDWSSESVGGVSIGLALCVSGIRRYSGVDCVDETTVWPALDRSELLFASALERLAAAVRRRLDDRNVLRPTHPRARAGLRQAIEATRLIGTRTALR